MASIIQAKTMKRFSLPKCGHGLEEYEDFANGDEQRGRFAIADGASASSFAGLWARLLVEGFLESAAPGFDSLTTWLTPVKERWAVEIGPGPFPWFMESKIQEGAFATFLGLSLQESRSWFWGRKERYWLASAVGDGCLFQVRKGELIKKFPVEHSKDFDNSPWLVGSRNSVGNGLEKKEQKAKGSLEPGDVFWMMTDALSCWFLQEVEAGRKPWEKLATFLAGSDADQTFAAWVEELRTTQQLRNDDVTLLAIGI